MWANMTLSGRSQSQRPRAARLHQQVWRNSKQVAGSPAVEGEAVVLGQVKVSRDESGSSPWALTEDRGGKQG